jgi:predicted secreted Zn-dependent protease
MGRFSALMASWKEHLKKCSKEYQAHKEHAKKRRGPVEHRITGKQAHLEPKRRKRRKNGID